MELAAPHPRLDPPRPDANGAITLPYSPCSRALLEVELDGVSRRFEWGCQAGYAPDPGEWKRLNAFALFLEQMVGRHPAMRTAPRSNCMYM